MKKIILVATLFILFVASVFANDFAFSDVPKDHWAYNSLDIIEKTGLVEGHPNGKFYGNAMITRYEFAMAVANFYTAYMEYAERNKIDPTSWATKSDISNYAKKSDMGDLSKYVTLDTLNEYSKLVEEFKSELAQLGVNVQNLKTDLDILKDKVAQVEAEQKRVQISGTLTLNGKYTDSSDKFIFDIDDRVAWSGAKKGVFSKDFQLDIKGKITNNIHAYMSLVAGDFLKHYYRGKPWESSMDNPGKYVLPYYIYTKMDSATYGDMRLGRLPFQINKYVFRKSGGDSYSFVPRMKDGNFPVDGIDYVKDFGPVDLKAWIVQPQTDMYCDTNLYCIDFNGIDTVLQLPYGMHAPIKAMSGAQLGFDISTARLEAIYNHARAYDKFQTYNAGDVNKANIYGGNLNIPIGSFGLNGAWYRQKTPNMHKYYLMNDNDTADLFDSNLTFDHNGLHLGLNYKDVGAGYSAPCGIWDGYAYMFGISNIKGWGADGNYTIGNFYINGGYKDYKVKDDQYDRVAAEGIYNTNTIRWYTGGVRYNTGSWGIFGLRYENIDNRSYKRDYWTLDWKKTFGKVDALAGIQHVNNDCYDQKGTIFYSSITYKF